MGREGVLSSEVEPEREKPVQASSAPTRPRPTIGCSQPAACHPPGPRAALAGFGFGRRGTPRDQAGSRWPGVGDQGDLATARPGARGSNFSMRSGSLGEGGHQGS